MFVIFCEEGGIKKVVLFKHLSIRISEFLNGIRVDIAHGRKLEMTKIEVVPSGMFSTS
jgi:hypothetical protein